MRYRSLFSQPYAHVGLLLLAALMMYAGSFSAPLVYDDKGFFDDITASTEKFRHAYSSLELRWLSYGSFIWMLDWLGFDLFWLRLGNVLLHAANAITLFFLLRRLFQVTLRNEDVGAIPSALSWLAFFGALTFTLHPVAVYSVAYLIQRSTLMATWFVLLMLLTYLEGLLRENSWRWMLVAALCYFAAVYSKEHSIAAPGVALALTLLIRKPSFPLLKQVAPFYMLATLIAVAVTWSTVSAKGALGSVYEPGAGGMLSQVVKMQVLADFPNVHLLSILTQTYLFFKYLGLWLLPNPAWMSADMREPFAVSLFVWPHSLGLVAFPAYFCAAVWLLLKRGRMGLLGFALLFPWILFLSEGATVRIQETFSLYRSYLWMPGLFAALPVVFGWMRYDMNKPGTSIPPRGTVQESAVLPESVESNRVESAYRFDRTTFFVLSCVCLLFVPLTLNRLHSFSSPLLLWDDAEKLVRNKPNVFGVEQIYYNRGTYLFESDRFEEAVADFNQALAIKPDYAESYVNRGMAYHYLGKYQDALGDYDRAIVLNPTIAEAYYGRAKARRELGDLASAQDDFRKSCMLGLCSQD